MIQVGAIVLDDNLLLGGEITSSGLAASARPTMGGLVIQYLPLPAGLPLTLSAIADGNRARGSYTREQLEQLAALRDSGAVIDFTHHLGSWQVWLPPDCLQVEPFIPYHTAVASDWYTGVLTMLTV